MASRFGSVVPLFLLLAGLCFLLSPADVAGDVTVTFVIQKKVEYGRGLVIAGNVTTLGNWAPVSGAQMAVNVTTEQDWSVTVDLDVDVGERVEYKPVITDYGTGDNPTWFSGYNLVFEVPDVDSLVVPIIWPDFSLCHIKEVTN